MDETIRALLAPGKGVLAIDESTGTAGKRLASINVESTEETRCAFRELFLDANGIEQYLSGAILYDETMRQSTSDGTPFPQLLRQKGIEVGIKVDKGAVDFAGFPNEVVTEGLDGLRERLVAYKEMGASFTKWRSVIRIGEGIPTDEVIHVQALDMARYAALAQEAGLVPIVEPEVLLEGTHTIEESRDAIVRIVSRVFYQIARLRGDISKTILKTSMALPGSEPGTPADPESVAAHTLSALHEAVPDAVPGVVFLSGGQSPEEARTNLAAIAAAARAEGAPWALTFSFARALQEDALAAWSGKPENIPAAREAFSAALKRTTEALQ